MKTSKYFTCMKYGILVFIAVLGIVLGTTQSLSRCSQENKFPNAVSSEESPEKHHVGYPYATREFSEKFIARSTSTPKTEEASLFRSADVPHSLNIGGTQGPPRPYRSVSIGGGQSAPRTHHFINH